MSTSWTYPNNVSKKLLFMDMRIKCVHVMDMLFRQIIEFDIQIEILLADLL